MCSHLHLFEYGYGNHAIKIHISFPPTPPGSPSPVGDDVIVVPVSVAMVVVLIIVAIVVSFITATIIIKYKHLKLTTNPTQSDSPPQEPPSSRCVRVVLSVQGMLTLYIAIFHFVNSLLIQM